MDLLRSFRGGNIGRELANKEVELTGRLRHNQDQGVIGIRSYPNPTAQPASLIYWNALGTWGLLRKFPDGDCPSRSAVHRSLSVKRATIRLLDDDGEPLEESWRVFVKLPDPPAAWGTQGAKLNFRLSKEEKVFLNTHLVALSSGSGNGETSLLARLVENKIHVNEIHAPWEDVILGVASENDRQALIRAGQTAALAAVGRGVYAALVESALERDGVVTDRLHRNALRDLVDKFRTEAVKLDIPQTLKDFPELSGKKITSVLEKTRAWLINGAKDPHLLHPEYHDAELARKGPVRAKLTNTPFGKERRREWSLNKGNISGPLHYRWKYVKRLLTDLQG